MGNSRFMVFKAKDLIKTVIFAVLGVAIILALIFFLTGRNSGTALYEPGTYTAQINLSEDTIEVQVTVTDDKIKEVNLVHTSETIPVFYPLLSSTMEVISEEIVRGQSVEVELPADASVTGQLLLDAVGEALAEATVH